MKLLIAFVMTTMFTIAAKAEYADINGLKMYYEIHGTSKGVPLVLLHGGGSTIDTSWGQMIPLLKDTHKIIAIEEQGHGRTSDRNAPVRFETSADDVAALLKHLNIAQIDVMGFSNGASVAMQLTIRHSALVHKLIFASSLTKRSGTFPQFWDNFKSFDISKVPPAYKEAFLKVTPDQNKMMTMLQKDSDRMKNFKDIPDKDVKAIKASTLIIQGQNDVAKVEHALALSKMIPNAKLIILPGAHGEYLGEILSANKESEVPEATAILLKDFLAQ